MDCFVASLLAMTVVHPDTTSLSRGTLRPRFAGHFRPQNRGRRECRMRAAPAVSCANARENAHTSIQVQRRQSDIPCAMALRLISRSPRRRIRLVTVVGGLRLVKPGRVDFASAQLGTSNGCQDHTIFPYASAPFVCMR